MNHNIKINGIWSHTLLMVTLCLTFLFLTPTAQPIVAQEAGDAPKVKIEIYESDDGESQITSYQMVLDAGDFKNTGTVENVRIVPGGLTLPENVNEGEFLSDPIPSPLDFTTDIGLTWQADIPDTATIKVEARLSDNGQSWGNWQPVSAQYPATPAGKHVGSLVWVNQANTYLQLKLSLQTDEPGQVPLLQQVTLYFNDTSQGPDNVASLTQDSEVPVNTCPAKPAVIPRTEWGCPGLANSPYWPPAYQSVTHMVINQTATPNSAADWASVVRSIWHYHAKILGWGDIGYNYLVDPLGNIYEGRAGGNDVIGAFDGFNRGAMGLGYIGCFSEDCEELWIGSAEPTPEMLSAGNALMAWKVGQKGLDPLGSGQYCYANLPTLVGRGEVTCRGYIPTGEFLAARIPEMRLDVAGRVAACEIPEDAPLIESVSPASGFNTTEVKLTITGQNFDPNIAGFSIALVNGLDTYPLSLGNLHTSTAFEAVVPAGQPVGLYDVKVTNPDGQFATAANAYESLEEGTGTETVVRFAPASLQVGLQQSEEMAVEIVNADNLYGTELKISYNPALVEVIDADPNADGTQVALGDVFTGVDIFTVKNEAADGIIHFSAARRAPAPAFAGTGSIIKITWRGISQGQTTLHLDQVKLSNSDGQSLEAILQPNGIVDVGDGTVVVIQGVVKLQGNEDSTRATVSWNNSELSPDPDGSFEIVMPQADSYQINITAPGFLSGQATGSIPDGTTEINLDTITLPGGEMTFDDYIDIFDLAYMAGRYDSDDPLADINDDGTVDIFDLTISASNYDRSGPVGVGVGAP